MLRVGHVIEPLGEERGDVPVVAGGAREDLGVAQPAEPLIALRAVGRHADEVAALAPVDVAEQLAEPGRRALEGAGGRYVGVHHPGHDVARPRLAGIAGDLGVPEPVQREAGFEDLRAARGEELVGLPGGAQVVGVEAAAGGQHLTVPDTHAGPGRPVHTDPQPAGQVLAEVGDVPPGAVRGHAHRRDLLDHPDRWPGVGDQQPGVAVAAADRVPACLVEAGGVPAVRFEGQVLPLAHQQVGVPDRGEPGPPAAVGDDLLDAAVSELEDQLGQELRRGPVVCARPLGVEPDET